MALVLLGSVLFRIETHRVFRSHSVLFGPAIQSQRMSGKRDALRRRGKREREELGRRERQTAVTGVSGIQGSTSHIPNSGQRGGVSMQAPTPPPQLQGVLSHWGI